MDLAWTIFVLHPPEWQIKYIWRTLYIEIEMLIHKSKVSI